MVEKIMIRWCDYFGTWIYNLYSGLRILSLMYLIKLNAFMWIFILDECYLIGGFISGFADLTFMLITQKVYAVREKLSHQRKDESCDNPYISQKCQNSWRWLSNFRSNLDLGFSIITQKLFIKSNFPFNHIYISPMTTCHVNFKTKYSFLKKILLT